MPLLQVQTLVIQPNINIGVVNDIKLALKRSVCLKLDLLLVASACKKSSQFFILFSVLFPPCFVQVNADVLCFHVQQVIVLDDGGIDKADWCDVGLFFLV